MRGCKWLHRIWEKFRFKGISQLTASPVTGLALCTDAREIPTRVCRSGDELSLTVPVKWTQYRSNWHRSSRHVVEEPEI